MADAQQDHDASSGDTVVSQSPAQKAPPLPAQETEHEKPAQREDEGNGEDNGKENGEENGSENGDQMETQPSGAPLDRTPSQAQRMGMKKIIVVMGALCVRGFIC